MSKKETILEALGLNESVIDSVMRTVINGSDSDKISDALELAGKELRQKLLGDVDYKLSEYEKSLLMVGFFTGTMMTEDGNYSKRKIIEKAVEELRKTFSDFDELSAPVEGDDCDCPVCRLRRFEKKKGLKIRIGRL